MNNQLNLKSLTEQQLQLMLVDIAVAEAMNLTNKALLVQELLTRRHNKTEMTGSFDYHYEGTNQT